MLVCCVHAPLVSVSACFAWTDTPFVPSLLSLARARVHASRFHAFVFALLHLVAVLQTPTIYLRPDRLFRVTFVDRIDRGIGPRLVRLGPGGGIMLVSFNAILDLLNDL